MAKTPMMHKVAALTAASLCVAAMAAPQARAGRWVVDHYECTGGDWLTYGNVRSLPGLGPAYITQSGNWSKDRSNAIEESSGQGKLSIFGSTSGQAAMWSVLRSGPNDVALPMIPGSKARTTTSVRAVLKWLPDNGDLTDVPPRYVYFRQSGWTWAGYLAGDSWQGQPPTSVALSMQHGFGTQAAFAEDASNGPTSYSIYATEIKRASAPTNTFRLPLPTHTRSVSVTASDAYNRSVHLAVGRSYAVAPFHMFPKRPEPAPKGDPVLKGNPENEFVLHGKFPNLDPNKYGEFHSSNPLQILARIGVNGENIDFDTLNFVRQKSAWRLTRPIPHQLDNIENGQQPLSANSGEVFPQTRSDTETELGDPTKQRLIKGLAFSGKNFLPESNSEFGGRVIEHIHQDNVIGKSPIEIFFSATRKEHPLSDDLRYCEEPRQMTSRPPYHSGPPDHLSPEFLVPVVPNWYYYYNKLWQNQWRVPIAYVEGDLSFVYADVIREGEDDEPTPTPTPPPTEPTPPPVKPEASEYFEGALFTVLGVQDHAHIADFGHGVQSTTLFARVPDKPYVKWVGKEYTRGLDYFARLTTQEAAHKRLADAVTRRYDGRIAANDQDNDLVPDAIEKVLGLNTNTRTTDRNWTEPIWEDDGDTIGVDCPDAEMLPRMCEQGLFADPEGVLVTRDWAYGGLNHGTPVVGFIAPPNPHNVYPPNVLQRTRREIDPDFSGKTLTFNGAEARAAIP